VSLGTCCKQPHASGTMFLDQLRLFGLSPLSAAHFPLSIFPA